MTPFLFPRNSYPCFWNLSSDVSTESIMYKGTNSIGIEPRTFLPNTTTMASPTADLKTSHRHIEDSMHNEAEINDIQIFRRKFWSMATSLQPLLSATSGAKMGVLDSWWIFASPSLEAERISYDLRYPRVGRMFYPLLRL